MLAFAITGRPRGLADAILTAVNDDSLPASFTHQYGLCASWVGLTLPL